MINLLMCQPSIVLQDVVVLCTRRLRDALRHTENLAEVVVRNVGQFGTMVLGDYQLERWHYKGGWSANI